MLPLLLLTLVNPAKAQEISDQGVSSDDVRLGQVLFQLEQKAHCQFNGDRDKWNLIKVSPAQVDLYRDDLGSFDDTLHLILTNTGFTFERIEEEGDLRVYNLYPDPDPNFMIRGIVTDRLTGTPLIGVRISARRSGRGTNSKADGSFELAVKSPDKVEFRAIGTVPYDEFITKERDQGIVIQIQLTPDNSSYTEQVEIVNSQEHFASLVMSPVTQVNFHTDKVEKMPSLGEGDVMQILSSLPGVSNRESIGEINVRGGNVDQNRYMLDGISLRIPQHFLGGLSLFNPRAIRDQHITYSGFRASQGRRISSLVELEGRSGLNQEGKRRPRGGFGINLLNMQSHMELPFLKGNEDIDLSVHVSGRWSLSALTESGASSPLYRTLVDNKLQSTDEVLRQLTQPNARVQLSPLAKFWDVNAKAELQIKGNDRISFTMIHGGDQLTYRKAVLGDAAYYLDTLQIRNGGMSLNWQRVWKISGKDKWYWPHSQTYLSSSHYGNDYAFELNGASFVNRHEQGFQLDEYSLKHLTEWMINDQHELEAGIELTRLQTEGDRQTLLDEVHPTQEVWQQQAELISSFAQYTLSYPKNVSSKGNYVRLSAGMRHTYYSPNRKNYWEPRTMLTYVIKPELHLRASWGRYHQFSSLALADNRLNAGENLFVLATADSISVLGAGHLSVGTYWKVGLWEFTLDAYQKNLQGLNMYFFAAQEVFAEAEPDQLLTNGQGLARGIEGMAKFEWKQLSGWVSYTLAQVRHQFAELNEGANFAAQHDQRHQLSIVAHYQIKDRWSLAANWTYSSGTPYTPVENFQSVVFLPESPNPISANFIKYGEVNAERLPDYHRLDLSLQYRFPLEAIAHARADKVGGTIGLNVINAYNRTNFRNRRYRVLPADLAESGQAELLTVDYELLGFTPNLFVRLNF